MNDNHIPAVELPAGLALLDGGMGQELRRRGVEVAELLWSGQALMAAPETVRAIHVDYIRAGARVITTNTYKTTRYWLEMAGVGDRFAELNRTAAALACAARAACGADVLIAGSLPPLHGSYRSDQVRPFDEIAPRYQEQAEILAPYVDLFLCETMSSGVEARAAAAGAAATGKPVWVAWTLADHGAEHLRSGETIAAAAAQIADLPVSGFLVNCCSPESVTAALPALARLGDQPFGAYANGFHGIPDDWRPGWDDVAQLGNRHDLDPEAYLRHVRTWTAAGARLIGGCCEIGPEHIARLHQAFRSEEMAAA